MNKSIHLLIFFLLSSFVSFSCVSFSADPPPLEEYRLEGKRAEAWGDIKKKFSSEAFRPCLARKGVTVSCSGCTAVMLRGIISIDRHGKFTGFETTFSRYCGSEMPADVKQCFLDFFHTIEFPPELRGVSIDVDLGRGLKC